MNTPAHFASPAPTRARTKAGLAVWLWALAIPVTAIIIDQVFRSTTLPLGMRGLLAFVPLVPGAFFFRAQSRALATGDELALRITNEGLMFTFYGLVGVFISVDLLENAGVLADFTWNTMRLIVAMFLLMTVGTVLSSRRYR